MTLVTGTSVLGSLDTWLGPLIIESSVKATVLLAVAAIAAFALRNNSAGRRHAIWTAAFVAIVLIPCAAHLLPGWNVLPAIEWSGADEDLVVTSSTSRPDATGVDLPREQMSCDAVLSDVIAPPDPAPEPASLPTSRFPRPSAVPIAEYTPVASHPTAGHQTSAEDGAQADSRFSPVGHGMSCLVFTWFVGILLWCGRLVSSEVTLRRLSLTSEQLRSGVIFDVHSSICQRLQIRESVRLFVGPPGSTPMAWGVFRPCVLLPRDAHTWTRQRLNAVLIHELGHIRRRDPRVQWSVQIARAIYWFHPLVWLAAGRIQVERERACDDLVLNSGLEATDYAEHLLHIASGFETRKAMGLTGIAMVPPHRLEGRLLAILSNETNRQPVSGNMLASVAIGVLAISLPLAMLGAQNANAIDKGSEEVFRETSVPSSALTRLGYGDGTAEGRQSIAGSGHAVRFQRPRDARYLMAIELFASRYGRPEAPDEDFHVYVLDENQKLIQAFPVPYATIARGDERWYTLSIPAVKVPRQFYVALSFNPHSTKGIYLAFDANVAQSHSYMGRPTTGFRAVPENHDWMVRAVLVPSPTVQNPLDQSAGR
ncbi:MAG: M56 family metallopeptidase [Pirellulaceae bacterium]